MTATLQLQPAPDPHHLTAPDPHHLTIDRRGGSDAVTLLIEGEIDLASAPALERELREAESSMPRRIVLDLAELEFIDNAGISLLFRAQERAAAAGHALALTEVPAQAQRLFSIIGFKTQVV